MLNKNPFAPLLILILVSSLGILALFLYNLLSTNKTELTTVENPVQVYENANPDLNDIDQNISGFSATFEITTNGTKRNFNNAMYFNLSNDVYINSLEPNKVHVKKPGTTWTEFFNTLPFKITKECLTTGTGQTFCTSDTQTLKFILNGVETPNVLDFEIGEGDKLEIIFK